MKLKTQSAEPPVEKLMSELKMGEVAEIVKSEVDFYVGMIVMGMNYGALILSGSEVSGDMFDKTAAKHHTVRPITKGTELTFEV
ncbi:MAG: hypothetical protein C5B59_06600 [Bacteroidetes bacterium]|nr:MAG: hypothetical protein C5B59_06600 [Bacteroidota bacterium]